MPTGRRAPTLDGVTVRRFWVAVLATLCVVVAAQAGPWQPPQQAVEPLRAEEVATPPAEPAGETAPEPAPELVLPGDPDPDLVWIRRAVVAAVAALLLFLLVRWALRRDLPVRPPPSGAPASSASIAPPLPHPEPDLDVLRAGARAAAEHLGSAASPVDAVIAAWVALEDAAARSGMVRERSATATEFTLGVLDRTAADPAAARALLRLYLRARFDDGPLADADVATAVRAARALVDTVEHR